MRLIERTHQLQRLTTLVSSGAHRVERPVLIDGPIGTGKTASLCEVRRLGTGQGRVVLSASCQPTERSIPFSMLSRMLRSTTPDSLRLSPHELAELSTPRPCRPSRRTVEAYRRHCLRLRELATATPLLIIVDDIHHADEASLRCLGELIASDTDSGVPAVLTNDSSLPVDGRAQYHQHLGRIRPARISLAPLSAAGVAELIAERLGAAEVDQLCERFTEFSGGNPRLLLALTTDWKTHGTATVSGYGAALQRCVGRGGQAVVQVANALAVLGGHGTPVQLAKVGCLRPEDVEVARTCMQAAGLLRAVRHGHQAGRTALIRGLSHHAAAQMQLQAAILRHEEGAPAGIVAAHLLLCRWFPPWAASTLFEASTQAVVDRERRFAADCLQLALRIQGHQPSPTAVVDRLVEIEWGLDPTQDGRYADLLRQADAGRLHPARAAAMAERLLRNGHTDRARHLIEIVRSHAEGHPGLVHSFERWLRSCHPTQAHPLTPGAAATVVKPHDAGAAEDPPISAAARMAELYASPGTKQAVAEAEALLRGLDLGHGSTWAWQSALLGLTVACRTDRPASTMQLVQQLFVEARRRGLDRWTAVFAGGLGDLALRGGDLSAAAKYARAALSHLPVDGWAVDQALPLATLLQATAYFGPADDVGRQLAQPVPQTLFESRYGLHYRFARGVAHLETGRVDVALAEFDTCGSTMRAWGLDLADIAPWRIGVAECRIRQGEVAQAARICHEQIERCADAGCRVRAMALHVLARAGPADLHIGRLTEALALFEHCGDRFMQACVLTDLCRAYQTTGDAYVARDAFQRAWQLAKACRAASIRGTLLSLALADQRFVDALVGGGRPRRPDGGRAPLTDAQRRVAALAAAGYTNREISMRLNITESTAEQHLTKIYRKLDITSRRSLPTTVGTDLPETW